MRTVTDILLEWTFKISLSTVHGTLQAKRPCILIGTYLIYLFQYPWKSYTKGHANQLEDIHRDAKALDKLPNHIAFVVLEEDSEFSPEDLARLAVWSLSSGIRYVTLYDLEGT